MWLSIFETSFPSLSAAVTGQAPTCPSCPPSNTRPSCYRFYLWNTSPTSCHWLKSDHFQYAPSISFLIFPSVQFLTQQEGDPLEYVLSVLLLIILQKLPTVSRIRPPKLHTQKSTPFSPACTLVTPSCMHAFLCLPPPMRGLWKALPALNHWANTLLITELQEIFSFLGKDLSHLPYQRICTYVFHRNNWSQFW